MEQQTEIPEIKEIEDQPVPEVEPVIARVKAAYILALELIRADKDVRYYLNGINVKPHPVLPGVLLTATNGHMAMLIHDEQGYASREFTLGTSKQLINCCKIKGTLTGSEWVEINGQEISVVKKCKYMEGDPNEQWHERELVVERFDHDAGTWADDETIPLRIVSEEHLFDLEEQIEKANERVKELEKGNKSCAVAIREIIAKGEIGPLLVTGPELDEIVNKFAIEQKIDALDDLLEEIQCSVVIPKRYEQLQEPYLEGVKHCIQFIECQSEQLRKEQE